MSKFNKNDEAYWNDPDNGECSKHVTIKLDQNVIRGEAVYLVIGNDGSEFEAFESELT